MGNRFVSTLFLFFSMVVTHFCYMDCAGNVSFVFPLQKDVTLYNDASIEADTIQLTSGFRFSTGWATLKKPVPLWDNSSRALASFTSHFQFVFTKSNGSNAGDGLTFFIAPFDSEPVPNASGEWLGLFNRTKDGESSNHVVAVEFDTVKNDNHDDVDDNHVGIDVNSVTSVAQYPLSSRGRFGNNTLHNGKAWDAWVDYDGISRNLKVFLLYNPSANLNNISKPITPILNYTIDLRKFIPENVRVGLSASTGSSVENHTVLSWNFSGAYSWEIKSAFPPINIPSPAPSRTENNTQKLIVIISVLVCLLGICACFLWYYRHRANWRDDEDEEGDIELDEQFAQGPSKFSYAQLSAATRNFSSDEILGRGGFGAVYRGILPGTNEAVAIKRISQRSRQGKKEYISEVTIISKLRHRNLVRLLGWCHAKGELLLVYEFLPNGSLDKYLFHESKDCMNWVARYSVACGIASALIYLHEEWDQRVVHRDVKASNVLLDSNFNAKLGDFGLARLVETDLAASRTTDVAGTRGYMAPEYMETAKASPESDVYSFGAVALEIACGRPPIDPTLNEYDFRVVAWVWDLHGKGKLLGAADKKLEGDFNTEEMELLMLVGLLCSHPDPKARPTMREVLKILRFDAQMPYVPLNMPVPVYTDHASVSASSPNLPCAKISCPLMTDPEAR